MRTAGRHERSSGRRETFQPYHPEMSSDLVAVAIAAAVFAVIAVVVIVRRPRRVATSKGAQERRASEAQQRGWTFEASGSGDEGACVYSGTTDFIPWRCEMRTREVSSSPGDGTEQRSSTRWWTDAARLPQGVVLVTPVSAPLDLVPSNLPPAMLARAAPALQMLGIDPRDAGAVSSAAVVEDPSLPQYRLRASDAATLRSFLDGGARAALADAASWLLPGRHKLLVVSLGSRGLAIVVDGWVDDLSLVDRIAHAGSQLAAARGQ